MYEVNLFDSNIPNTRIDKKSQILKYINFEKKNNKQNAENRHFHFWSVE